MLLRPNLCSAHVARGRALWKCVSQTYEPWHESLLYNGWDHVHVAMQCQTGRLRRGRRSLHSLPTRNGAAAQKQVEPALCDQASMGEGRKMAPEEKVTELSVVSARFVTSEGGYKQCATQQGVAQARTRDAARPVRARKVLRSAAPAGTTHAVSAETSACPSCDASGTLLAVVDGDGPLLACPGSKPGSIV